jgi:hypothetical protein
MRRSAAVGSIVVGVMTIVAFASAGSSSGQSSSPDECRRGTFADYHRQGEPDVPPDGYSGPVFELSQDYPDSVPPLEDYPWLEVDIDAMVSGDGRAARDYIEGLFSYALEGNIENGDWVPSENATRSWFHAPWLDFSDDGREFVRGLTHELDSLGPAERGTVPGPENQLLGPDQTETQQTWAVGVYNDRGGYGIGQIWCDPDNPDPDRLESDPSKPNAFLDGTVVVKLLFTTAPDEEAPYLAGTLEWTAHIYTETHPYDPNSPVNLGEYPRTLGTVRMIQMDLAVRDDRLPLGWAFGTMAYDGSRDGDTPFERLVPLGLQWGNNPGLTPSMIGDDPSQLTEQWINDDIVPGRDKGLHLGWGGRLAGPLDNPGSSCMSCHSTAGAPAAPLVPEAADWAAGRTLTEAQRLNWFNNVPAGVPFNSDQRASVDYSLQTAIGLQRFYVANCTAEALDEAVSARGPDLPAPSAVAAATCDQLASPATGGQSDDVSVRTAVTFALVVAVVAAAVGFGLASARRSRDPEATRARSS